MTDVVTPAAAGVVAVPILAAMGLDPASLVAGLVVCIIIQTLIPSGNQSVKSVCLLTTGSVLFASLFSPVFSPIVVDNLHMAYPKVSTEAIQSMTAAVLGGFAQPLVIAAKQSIMPGFICRLKALFTIKGSGDA